MPETRHVATRCPRCEACLDTSGAPDGSGAQPKGGDATVCLYCGTGLMYRDDLTLRFPTESERQELALMPAFAAAQRISRAFEKRSSLGDATNA